jgi:hypothetical protein
MNLKQLCIKIAKMNETGVSPTNPLEKSMAQQRKPAQQSTSHTSERPVRRSGESLPAFDARELRWLGTQERLKSGKPANVPSRTSGGGGVESPDPTKPAT